ncbi:hypothetical protein [Myceligenerans xiligouense]|uniref:hypothetical protein n=1 Tax=Myceligenerans xiligouense TaxID=253184 RepID=UPI000F506965|nr:hypothetical protein [Myceligenerans xiligouense]
MAVISLVGAGLGLIGRSMSHSAIHGGDWRVDASLIAVTAVAFVVLLVVLVLPPYTARRDRLVAQVRQARSDAVVIPAYSSRDLWSEAVEAGAGTGGIARRLTTTLAVALVGDTAEIWIRDDREPRWFVRRTDSRVELRQIEMGQTSQLGLRISDGVRSVSFVPHYGVTNTIGSVERALADLGEDPADHLAP